MITTATNSSLYQRLGGYDVIAAFVDDTYQVLRNDPKFSRFAAHSIDSQQRGRQLLVDQILPFDRWAVLLILAAT
jgi:hemoglobin